MPPIEFMHKTRITKAEELLLTSNVSIEALAGMLGYCDASHFSRMFRRLTGITASAYRKRLWK
ncbi:HTH-type transcriptional activator Btr [compost metagenome]